MNPLPLAMKLWCVPPLRRVWVFVTLALVLGGTAPVVADDSGPTGPSPTPTEAAIPVAQIAERAESDVRAIRARMQPDAAVAAVNRDLPAAAIQIEQLEQDSNTQIGSEITLQGLDELRRQWQQQREQLASWAQGLGARTDAIERESARLTELDDTWAKTSAAARADNLPDAVREMIRSTRADIRDAQTQLRSERDVVLATLGRISTLQAQVADGLDTLDDAERRMRRDLFALDAPPLWTALGERSEAEPLIDVLRETMNREVVLLTIFVRQQRGRIATHGVVLVLLLIGAITLARRREVPESAGTELTRPISAALLLALLLSFVLYPYAPAVLTDVVVLLGVLPIVRLLASTPQHDRRLHLVILVAIIVGAAIRRLGPASAPIPRLLLLAENGLIGGWVLLMVRQVEAFELTDVWRRAGVLLGRIALALIALALALNVIGNVSLTLVLTHGIASAVVTGFALSTTDRILVGVLEQIITSPVTQRVHSIASHARRLRVVATKSIRVVIGLAWFLTSLRFFGLLRPFMDALRAVLSARLAVGAVSLSLGDCITVVVTLWIAFALARVVRALLEEDILPRLSLPRGVPAAISAGANYAVLLLGFVFALSAAGIDPGRVALVAGALSVGIGFGLQTVVNNFVSGLILLLERPIQIGDTIEIGNVTGQVRHIGIRSSLIATADGAEVIVPNATLIAERVINWTLTNFRRRIEITVGVAYGSEPAQVLALLEGAARGVTDVLGNPAPQAVFVGFGDSSLDFALRVWTNRQDMLGVIRSRIALAIYDALRQANIEIPFPQHEVRLKSSDAAPRNPPVDDSHSE